MPLEDCWKDMARIPGSGRYDVNGKWIPRTTICDVTINNKHKRLMIRGCYNPEGDDCRILLDSSTRHDFSVQIGTSYEVELRPVGWLGRWRWAWSAADPAYRVTAQVSLISLGLGVISFILGVVLPFVHFSNSK
jgi:hypothetical protein